jgi:hypothetical protein
VGTAVLWACCAPPQGLSVAFPVRYCTPVPVASLAVARPVKKVPLKNGSSQPFSDNVEILVSRSTIHCQLAVS